MRKRQCQALKCSENIKRDDTFCQMHWSVLDADVQDELAQNYTSGQTRNYKLKTRDWYQAVSKARAYIKAEEVEQDDEESS